MTAMRWGRRVASAIVLVGLVAIGLGRGVGAQTGPAFSAQIQLALRALLAGDQTITGNWTCSGTCSGFGGGGGGTPAGPANSIQFNDAGSFGGFGEWDGTSLSLPSGYFIATSAPGNAAVYSEVDSTGQFWSSVADETTPSFTFYNFVYDGPGQFRAMNNGDLHLEMPNVASTFQLGGRLGINDLTGQGGNAINYADKFVVDASGKTLIGPDLATLTAADAYITGNGLADSTTRITGLNPTTSAMASWILQTDATTTYAFSDTAEFYNFLGGTQGGDAQALYVRTFGTGDISEIDGQWVYPGHTSTGTLGTLRYVALGDPDKAGGAGAIGTVQAIWVPALSGWGSANTYSFWHDADGVFRIKEDNHFDSVYQAIPALYNPLFTKYTPGAADYERGVWEWNGNVFEMGAQNGGTGTLRNTRVLGAATLVDGLKTTGAATGKKVVCVDTATGQLYASSTGTDCSN